MLSSLNLEKVNCSIIKGDTLEFVKVQKIVIAKTDHFWVFKLSNGCFMISKTNKSKALAYYNTSVRKVTAMIIL
jgi:hypothetical protein